MTDFWTKFLLFATIFSLTSSLEIRPTHLQLQVSCWKDSYFRKGDMTDCSNGRTVDSQCYELCPEGYTPKGASCESLCPTNMGDAPGKCIGQSYSRPSYGASFSGATRLIQLQRCELGHGKGNCEVSFISVVPKCRPGYHPQLLTCQLSKIDCIDLGMEQLTATECKKKGIIQQPRVMVATCSAGQVFQTGVCYEQCKPGFEGIGDLCLENAPKNWFDCGLGGGIDSKNCYGPHPGELTEIGGLALDLGRKISAFKVPISEWRMYHNTLLPILKVWMVGVKAILQKSQQIKELEDKVISILGQGMAGDQSYQSAQRMMNTLKTIASADFEEYSVTDFTRLAAEVVSLANPNGIAGSQGRRSKCSAIK